MGSGWVISFIEEWNKLVSTAILGLLMIFIVVDGLYRLSTGNIEAIEDWSWVAAFALGFLFGTIGGWASYNNLQL